MPRSNGKIYIDTTVTPNLGVDFIADIAYLLGVSSGDLGYIISNGSINPWAIFKATRDSNVKMINRPDFDFDGTMASLGLGNANGVAGPVSATTVQGLINLYTDSETLDGKPANGWRYLRPRGKETYNEPFRAFDFARIISSAVVAGYGYNSNANNPFGTFTCIQNISRHSGAYSASVGRTVPAGDVDDTMIVIGSFNAKLANTQKMWYFGVLLVPPSTSYAFKLIGNMSEKITDGMTYRGHENIELESSYLLNDTDFAVGVYTAYPFLTNIPFSGSMLMTVTYANRNTPLADGRKLYSLPGCVPLSVNIFDFYVAINVHATTATSTPGGTYETEIYFTIKNNYSSSITISNFMLKWRNGNTSYSDARQSGEVFYDKARRYDNSYPSGVADNTFASFLADMTLASGEEKTVPSGGLAMMVTIPGADYNTLFIGAYINYTNMFGSTTVRLPASGTNLELV